MNQQNSNSNSYDLIVIGAGIAGLSAAFHLEKKGYRRILVLTSDKQAPVSMLSAGFVAPGFLDNFTRLSHQFGHELAAELWRAGDAAFIECRQFCLDSGVALQEGKRWRFASSPSEAQEMRQAGAQLQKSGFQAKIFEPENYLQIGLSELSGEIKAVQEEGPGGFYMDAQALCHRLYSSHLNYVNEHVLKLEAQAAHMRVHTSSKVYQAEMVIVAAHTATNALAGLPEDSLVPYADQWQEFRVSWEGSCPLPVGSVFSIKHGYFWGVVTDERHLRVGGGRFMRPFAGIGADTADFDERICQLTKKELERSFSSLRIEEHLKGEAGIEIRPCDELPVIGPKFGEPRLLLAAGFMGLGLSWGFWAGQQIAELVDCGQAPALPRQLWPERLRSWEK